MPDIYIYVYIPLTIISIVFPSGIIQVAGDEYEIGGTACFRRNFDEIVQTVKNLFHFWQMLLHMFLQLWSTRHG